MHDTVDLIALIVALLGLIPLWWDARRKFIASAFSVLILVGIGYVLWTRHEDAAAALARQDRVNIIWEEIRRSVCRSHDGMNFEQLTLVTDREEEWPLVDDALGLLQQKVLRVDTVNVPSWDTAAKDTIQIRVWRINNRNIFCHDVDAPSRTTTP
jgi:hypothetical protein